MSFTFLGFDDLRPVFFEGLNAAGQHDDAASRREGLVT